jgi:hypothetical protein
MTITLIAATDSGLQASAVRTERQLQAMKQKRYGESSLTGRSRRPGRSILLALIFFSIGDPAMHHT